MRVFCYNDARCKVHADLGKTGYEEFHGKPWEGVCVPFGCRIRYIDDSADKFESRRSPGVFLSYGPEDGSYLCLDEEAWDKDRTVRVVLSRDVQIDRNEFPFQSKQKVAKEDYEKLQAEFDSFGQGPPSYTDMQ